MIRWPVRLGEELTAGSYLSRVVAPLSPAIVGTAVLSGLLLWGLATVPLDPPRRPAKRARRPRWDPSW